MMNARNPNDETKARNGQVSAPGLRFVILHSDLVIHSGIRGFGDSGIPKCLEWRVKNLGAKSPATALTAAAMADLFDRTGQSAKAAQLRTTYGLIAPSTGPSH